MKSVYEIGGMPRPLGDAQNTSASKMSFNRCNTPSRSTTDHNNIGFGFIDVHFFTPVLFKLLLGLTVSQALQQLITLNETLEN
jgi:hypothetical protein